MHEVFLQVEGVPGIIRILENALAEFQPSGEMETTRGPGNLLHITGYRAEGSSRVGWFRFSIEDARWYGPSTDSSDTRSAACLTLNQAGQSGSLESRYFRAANPELLTVFIVLLIRRILVRGQVCIDWTDLEWIWRPDSHHQIELFDQAFVSDVPEADQARISAAVVLLPLESDESMMDSKHIDSITRLSGLCGRVLTGDIQVGPFNTLPTILIYTTR